MLVITNDVVARVLTIGDTMDALESVMREEALGTAGNRRGQGGAIHVPAERGGRRERLDGRSEHNKLTDVIVGRLPGRRDAEEITHFHTVGTGTQFAAVAKLVYDRARDAGLGHELPDEWFIQDIRD